MSARKIQLERELAKNYELPTIEGAPHLVALSRDNVARVEAMIRTDSNYRISLGDENDNAKYSPYWLKKLGGFLKGEPIAGKIEDVIDQVVKLLDKENSTHLNTDGVGRKEMTQRILAHNKTLLSDLRNRNFNFIKIFWY